MHYALFKCNIPTLTFYKKICKIPSLINITCLYLYILWCLKLFQIYGKNDMDLFFECRVKTLNRHDAVGSVDQKTPRPSLRIKLTIPTNVV